MFRRPERSKIAKKAMGKEGWKMISLRLRMIIALAFISALIFGCAKMPPAKGQTVEVPRITKEELEAMLGNPDVIILDVRVEGEWDKSKSKIQGAIHEDSTQGIQSWAEKYPKDKTFVLYCS